MYSAMGIDNGPNNALLCTFGTERWRSPAAGSGSDAGADAGGSQVQRFVRRRGPHSATAYCQTCSHSRAMLG